METIDNTLIAAASAVIFCLAMALAAFFEDKNQK